MFASAMHLRMTRAAEVETPDRDNSVHRLATTSALRTKSIAQVNNVYLPGAKLGDPTLDLLSDGLTGAVSFQVATNATDFHR